MTKEDVKKFLEENKVKIAIGAAVTGAVVASIVFKKKVDSKVVKETVHKVTSKATPMTVLVDAESALGKLGFKDYDHYGNFAEMMLDDPNRMPVSKLGELGEALINELGIKPNDRVWMLLNVEVSDQ